MSDQAARAVALPCDRAAPVGKSAVRRLALSKAEVAQALGVSADFVEDHVWAELRIVRRGRKCFVSVSELQRWLDENGELTFGRTT